MKALRILLVVAVAMMMMVPAALAEITFSGDVEVQYDFDVKDANVDADGDKETTQGFGGRVRLKINSKKEADNGMYASAYGAVDLKNGGISADTARLEIGAANWNMQFLKPDMGGVFNKGQDTYLISADGDPGRAEGKSWVKDKGVVVNFTASESIKLQLGVLYAGSNQLGVRPRVQFSAGAVTIKAATEYYMERGTNEDAKETTVGIAAGGSVEAGLGAITVGASTGYELISGKDAQDNDKDEIAKVSFFGYAKMAVGDGTIGVGGGLNGWAEDVSVGDNAKAGMNGYVSYSTPILGVDSLKLSVGVSYGIGVVDTGSEVDSSAFGGRVRLNYGL